MNTRKLSAFAAKYKYVLIILLAGLILLLLPTGSRTKAKTAQAAAVSEQTQPQTIQAEEQRAETFLVEDAEIVLVAFGATSRICRSAVRAARDEGIKAGLIRPITLWPFPEDAIKATIPTAKAYLAVEMSMGQMVDDVRLVVNGARPVEFYGRTGGVIPTPDEVLGKIREMAASIDSAKGGE